MSVSSFSQKKNDKSMEAKASAAAVHEVNGADQVPSSPIAQTLQDVAANVSQKAQDWASNVANKAQETATAVVDKANDGIAAAGHRLNEFGGTVRNAAPQDGVLGSAAATVADKLQAGGSYLEGHGLQDIGNDLTSVIKNYPIQAVLVGFGVGCLLGMMLRRS